MRHINLLLAMTAAIAASCSTAPTSPATGTSADPIIGGQLDRTHQAVVLIVTNSSEGQGMCSGTIIQKNAAGTVGYVLTAGHCVTGTVTNVFEGDDINRPTKEYSVIDSSGHPRYTGSTSSSYDFGLVRIGGVNGSTPILPYARPAEDNVAVGASVTSVGYGRTTPLNQADTENTQRRSIARTVSQRTSTHLAYSERGGGACSGDSGGPMLASIGGRDVVVGVHSYVTDGCLGEMWSGRASLADAWIQQIVSGSVPPPTCAQCRTNADNGNGVCGTRRRACMNDRECTGLIDCANNCQAQACVDQCLDAHPLGIGPLLATQECFCTNDCAAECGGTDECADVPKCGLRYNPSSCTTCQESSCCAESAACGADGVCFDCLMKQDGPAACANNPKRKALEACVKANCNSECAGRTPTTDGGAGGKKDGGAGGDASEPTENPDEPGEGEEEPVQSVNENQPSSESSGSTTSSSGCGVARLTSTSPAWLVSLAGVLVAASFARRRNRRTSRG